MAEKTQKLFEILPIRNKFMIYFVENGCEIHMEFKPSTNKLIINKYDGCEKSHESLFLVLLSLKVDKSMINAETKVVTGVVDTAKTTLPSIDLSPSVQISGAPVTLAEIEATNTVVHSPTETKTETKTKTKEVPQQGLCDPTNYYSCMDSTWKKQVSDKMLPAAALFVPEEYRGAQMPQMQWSQMQMPQMQWSDSITFERIVNDFYERYPNGTNEENKSRFIARLYENPNIDPSVIDRFLNFIEENSQGPTYVLPDKGSLSNGEIIQALRVIYSGLKTEKEKSMFVDDVSKKYPPIVALKFKKQGGKKTRKAKKKQKSRRKKI